MRQRTSLLITLDGLNSNIVVLLRRVNRALQAKGNSVHIKSFGLGSIELVSLLLELEARDGLDRVDARLGQTQLVRALLEALLLTRHVRAFETPLNLSRVTQSEIQLVTFLNKFHVGDVLAADIDVNDLFLPAPVVLNNLQLIFSRQHVLEHEFRLVLTS